MGRCKEDCKFNAYSAQDSDEILKVTLPKMCGFFKKDFGGNKILSVLQDYLGAEKKAELSKRLNYKVNFVDYNWKFTTYKVKQQSEPIPPEVNILWTTSV